MKSFSLTLLFVLFFLAYNPFVQSQDIDAIMASLEIDTILYSGPKDNRINWAIQNRGTDNPNNDFSGKEEFMNLFKNDLFRRFTKGGAEEQIPYAQYRNFFNLYAIWWPEALSESEGWNFGILKSIRDSLFLPWSTDEFGWATLFSSTKYGGGGGSGLDRKERVGDGKMYGMGWETFLHEFGHTMPGLLDEYSASGEWSGGQCWETPNTTGNLIWEDIPWRKWIDPNTPLPTPYTGEYLESYGAFEGALTNYFGCHRPTARGCYMGAGGFGEDYGQELCGPCVQRVICYLNKYVNVIEDYIPKEKTIEVSGFETLHFEADVLAPEPNTQKYVWILNGKVIARGVTQLDLSFGKCSDYELKFTVADTNTLVKYDEKFEDIYPKPYREIVWQINQSEIDNYNLEIAAIPTHSDCTGQENGSITLSGSGGLPPYYFYYQNNQISNDFGNLAPGEYQISMVDSNGCGEKTDVIIESEPLLEPIIRAEHLNGLWNLDVDCDHYPIEELEILWSTGDKTTEVPMLPDGTYEVQLTTNMSCSVKKSVTLYSTDDEMMVQHSGFNAETGKNTGQIYLDISGGRPPYTIDWEDNRIEDITDTNTVFIEASGTTWGHLPEYAFDDNLATKWLHFVSTNAWISYESAGGEIITAYSITSADDVPERDPKNWRFEASNDGVLWKVLDEQTDQQFTNRFEKRTFELENEEPYQLYRFFITKNHGDGSIQVQELEFLGFDSASGYVKNFDEKNKETRINLKPGLYKYSVSDQNLTTIENEVLIKGTGPSQNGEIKIIQDGICQLSIENPDPLLDYYWFSDAKGGKILQVGTRFSPPDNKNYFVGSGNSGNKSLNAYRKGFSANVEISPLVEIIEDSILSIIDPTPDLTYYWYQTDDCSDWIGTGNTFVPIEKGVFYFVSAYPNKTYPDPIDPKTIEGIVVRMDASDLNGDGVRDNPPPETSSTLDWMFENGNHWSDGSWFAFRSNYQNGLGVVDFGTIWLQRIENAENGYQTVMMAYRENPLSFSETAPFEGLSVNIPKHVDESQLFASNSPSTTLNGKTFLNGNRVDPLNTANPMDFCILGTKFTEPSSAEIFYTDVKWEGKLGEMILWDHALSDAEMYGVSEYLRKKWLSIADLESPKRAIFIEDNTTELEKISKENLYISITPNPVSDVLKVSGLENFNSVIIQNMEGMVLQHLNNPGEIMFINVGNLPSGIYLITGKNVGQGIIQSLKFIKE